MASFKELMGKSLTCEEREHLKTAFDVIGDIAILEIDEALRPKEKFIAETLLACQKNIKTVLRKASAHEGTYRTQKLKYLAGERKKVTIHRESGCRLMLDVEKVYFSPRMGHERLRIAQQVKPGERILVMFSGCAPYPVVLAKNARPTQVVAIELNPRAHQYALTNVRLNKLDNVALIRGHVRMVVKTLTGKFDRIIMPLPRGGEHFLDCALAVAKRGSIIHFYDFLHESEFARAEEKVALACRRARRKYRPLTFAQCGQYSPRTHRICLDFKITL